MVTPARRELWRQRPEVQEGEVFLVPVSAGSAAAVVSARVDEAMARAAHGDGPRQEEAVLTAATARTHRLRLRASAEQRRQATEERISFARRRRQRRLLMTAWTAASR